MKRIRVKQNLPKIKRICYDGRRKQIDYIRLQPKLKVILKSAVQPQVSYIADQNVADQSDDISLCSQGNCLRVIPRLWSYLDI